MTILRPPAYSASDFTWRKNPVPSVRETIGTCEASDLGDLRFGQVYDDACDEGITLVNHETGTECVFAISHTEIDTEGDVLWWELKAVTRGHHHIRIKIFND